MTIFCEADDCAMATMRDPQTARGVGWQVPSTSSKDPILCPYCQPTNKGVCK